MICKNCETENEEDAIFCKKCGQNLYEEVPKQEKAKKEKIKKEKVTKVKDNSNEIKKMRAEIAKENKRRAKEEKKKKKEQKIKEKKEIKNNTKVIIERKSSLFQKALILFLFLVIILLVAVASTMGYYIWDNQGVTVPNLTSLSYSEAELALAKVDLKINKKEVSVSDSSEVGVVIEQSKSEGSIVNKNSTITVIVGVEEDTYTLDDYTGMNIDDVKEILDTLKIKYKVTYKETDGINDNVLSQSPNPNTKFKYTDTVKLIVIKNEQDENIDIEDNNETKEETKEQ